MPTIPIEITDAELRRLNVLVIRDQQKRALEQIVRGWVREKVAVVEEEERRALVGRVESRFAGLDLSAVEQIEAVLQAGTAVRGK